MTPPSVRRRGVLRFRFRRHQLHGGSGERATADVALLDFGVQDTGTDGAAWAMHIRGATPPTFDGLSLAWTVRGAPHAYRTSELAPVSVATAPFSEADAAKRIFDAAKPLRAAGIPPLTALAVIAGHMRAIVTRPTVKGDVSTRLTERLDAPYLRYCRPCAATHAYEMPFRLAAVHAGLELVPDTSPPVLQRVRGLTPPRYRHLAGEADARFDVVRNAVRFYGPTRVRDVAAFLDAPVKDVKRHWPEDAVEVTVADVATRTRSEAWFVLADDLGALAATERGDARAVRLVGPYDPYLQLRDRELLVDDEARRKDLWRVLGRPGAIVADGDVLGTWRPRAAAGRLTLRIEPWAALRPRDRALVEEQAERLADFRGVRLVAVTEE